MKRRPRLQLKPNVPSKAGANKIDAESVENIDSASVSSGGTQDAQVTNQNSDIQISGECARSLSVDEKLQSVKPSVLSQTGVTEDHQNCDVVGIHHLDQSGLPVIASETSTAGKSFKNERTEMLSNEPASIIGQETGSSLYAENSCSVIAASTNELSSVDNLVTSRSSGELSDDHSFAGAGNSCSLFSVASTGEQTITECSSSMTSGCKVIESIVESSVEKKTMDAMSTDGSQSHISSEKSTSVVGGDMKSSRRFTRIRPNLSNITKQKQSSSAESVSSVGEPQNTETHAVIVHQNSDIVGDKSNASTDIVDSIGIDTEPLKPSDTTNDGKNLDATDSCKSPCIPMSPPSASMRIPHQFTKMRPNLPQNTKPKKSSENVLSTSALDAEDEPFIPPPVLQPKQPSSGIEASVEEDVACEESIVILPESAVKAAAKVIERKLKEKRKKRALENIETPVDSSKVCMRDLIYMNPVNNPMKSKSVEGKQNGSAVASVTPVVSSASAPSATPTNSVMPKKIFTAPQLKIKEDGSIVLDEASLIIERQPVKTYDHMEAIDETDLVRCGYPKKTRTRAWNKQETMKFFAALSMIGTDFFLMAKFFRKRTRTELKSKFKREEKIHPAMVETALKERRNLDMSVMMAVDSSDEEELKPSKNTPVRVPGQKRSRKQVSAADKDPDVLTGGKENEPHASSIVKTKKRRRRENERPSGKKQKKTKSRYYEESSDDANGDFDETDESESDASTEENVKPPTKKVSSIGSSDEDEAEIINCMSTRPTRSGRVPKPVKMYNEVHRPADDEEQAHDAKLPVSVKRVSVKKKLPTVQPILSSTRSGGPMAPSPVASTSYAPGSSSCVQLPPMPDSSFGSPTVAPVCSSVSCSPSQQLPFIPMNIPPGKQLMILASPIMQSENKEPTQVMLDFLLVSSPPAGLDCQNQVLVDSIHSGSDLSNPMTSIVPPLLRTIDCGNHARDTNASVSADSCAVLSISAQQFSNCTDSSLDVNSLTVDFTQNGNLCSTDCSGDRLSMLSAIASSPNEVQLETSKRTLTTSDISISPMLSCSALEYCVTQVSNMEPMSLDFSDIQSPNVNHDSEDSELEGTVTDIMQQDDGTVVLVAESFRSVGHTGDI